MDCDQARASRGCVSGVLIGQHQRQAVPPGLGQEVRGGLLPHHEEGLLTGHLPVVYIQPMDESIEKQAREVVATCLGYRTRRLARSVTRLYNDRLRPLGLNIAQMILMAAIAGQRSVQPASLGRAMELEKSTLSRNISRLVDRGWVEMRDHPNGRGVLLTLTARGNETLLHALPRWREAQERAQSLVAGTPLDLRAGEASP